MAMNSNATIIMGCCSSTDKVLCSNSKECINLDCLSPDEAANELQEFIEHLVQINEQQIKEKITPDYPRGGIEFDQIFSCFIYSASNSFNSKFQPIPQNEEMLEVFNYFRLYLISKCKSKEGFLRFLNNFYSFQHNLELKNHIINQFCDRRLTTKTAIECYESHAKGTYVIEGLQDMHELLKLKAKSEMRSALICKAEITKAELESDWQQLERASRKPLIPAIFSESDSLNHSPTRAPLKPSSLSKEAFASKMEELTVIYSRSFNESLQLNSGLSVELFDYSKLFKL